MLMLLSNLPTPVAPPSGGIATVAVPAQTIKTTINGQAVTIAVPAYTITVTVASPVSASVG